MIFSLPGSATLHQWQQLAQPNLGGILDTRPGVVTKGFRPLELDLEHMYLFTDFEEEDFEVVEESDHLSVSGSTPGCSGISILSRQGLRTRSSSCSSSCSGRSINNNLPEGEAREEGKTGPGSTSLSSPAPPDSENQENQDQAAAADGVSGEGAC